MKPIKLKINAFGSFINETIIDFEELNKSGFYLITGPTGSGKTTIFDAIMFALYGEASGNIRTQDGLRNDLAEDKNPTYVEFTFEKDLKTYIITRNPRYTVSSRKTPIESKVSLQFDNQVIEKNGPVSEEIQNIIGLNANQFRQIIMLAQGEFMKLIHAKSNERDEIFRKIFGTEIFEQIENTLKQETKDLKNNQKIIENKISSLINNIPTDLTFNSLEASLEDFNNLNLLLEEIKQTNHILKTEIKELKTKQSSLNNLLIETIKEKENSQNINHQFALLDEIKNQLNELNQKTIYINELKEKVNILKQIESIKPLHDEVELLQNQFFNAKTIKDNNYNLFNEKQEELNFFIDQTNMIELDRLSLVNLNKVQEELKTNLDLKLQLIQIEKNNQEYIKLHDDTKTNVDKLTDSLEILEEAIFKCKEKIKSEPNVIFQINNTQKEIDTINFNARSLQNVEDLYTQYKEVLAFIEKTNNEYLELYRQYQEAESKYQNTEYCYFKNIAKVLAKTLKENMPCPVCGSTSHPNIIETIDFNISKEDVDLLNEEVNKLRTLKDNVVLKMETFKQEKNNLIKIICTNLEIDSLDDYDQMLKQKKKEIEEQTKRLAKELTNNELELNKINKEKEKLGLLENEKEIFKQNLDKANEELIQIIKEHSKLIGEKEAIINKITIQNPIDEIKEAIAERVEAINELDSAIKGFDEEYQKTKQDFALIKGNYQTSLEQVNTLEKQLNNSKNLYLDAIKEINLSTNLLNEYFKELSNLTIYIETITKYDSTYKSLKDQESSLLLNLTNKKVVDLSIFDDKISKTKKELEDIDCTISIKQNHFIILDSIYKQLKNNFEEFTLLNNKLIDLNEINLVANGQNNHYLSFERYVLIEYFDNILQHANVRLSKMTNGRYVLYRKNEKSKGRAQQGLDMEIFDFETGKKRDVTTLSGGETFKAALSLALGLSDTIESRVGGVQIDALFIDEGFGTLDDESLNQAINILLELQGKNKSIGIISHVQELKDIIPTKLVVYKDDFGSKVKIIK